jgi:hypothetical protein
MLRSIPIALENSLGVSYIIKKEVTVRYNNSTLSYLLRERETLMYIMLTAPQLLPCPLAGKKSKYP